MAQGRPSAVHNTRGMRYRVGKSLVQVGAYTYGVEHLKFKEWGQGVGLTIGRFCSLASDITIYLGGRHSTEYATTYPFGILHTDIFPTDHVPPSKKSSDIVIGHDVWIASDVTIMPGVTIGSGAVIAAGSHVVKDIEDYMIVGGNPATPIKPRFAPDITAKLKRLAWWEFDPETVTKIAPTLLKEPTAAELDHLLSVYRGTGF